MDQEQEIVQAIAEALQQGIAPEEIVQGLVDQMQIPQDQAMQLVQAVMQQMGGEQGGQEGGSGGGVTAEQAMDAFEQLQVPPDVVMQIVDVILNMSPSEIERLAQLVSGAPSEEEAPAEEQGGYAI